MASLVTVFDVLNAAAQIGEHQEAARQLALADFVILSKLDRAGDPEAAAHYRVILRLDKSNLEGRQATVEVRPGMQASVELHTGAKTVLQYLLKPLYKSREAFREP